MSALILTYCFCYCRNYCPSNAVLQKLYMSSDQSDSRISTTLQDKSEQHYRYVDEFDDKLQSRKGGKKS